MSATGGFGPAIAAALVAFQKEMPKVHKGKTATVPTKNGGSYSYDYADLVSVTDAAIPVLGKHGLAFVALPRQTERGYELAGTLVHESGETMQGALPLTGGNEQALGSSLTYHRRYLLGCMTGIVTDADDDGAAATHAPRVPEPTREEQAAAAARGLAGCTTPEQVREMAARLEAHQMSDVALPSPSAGGATTLGEYAAERLQAVQVAA